MLLLRGGYEMYIRNVYMKYLHETYMQMAALAAGLEDLRK